MTDRQREALALLGFACGTRDTRPEVGSELLSTMPERLLPLVAEAMMQSGAAEGAASSLVTARRSASIPWLARKVEAAKMSRALSAAGIRCVFLKGFALAVDVYPDPALRPMQDIDIWVPLSELPAVARVLETAGFEIPERHRSGADEAEMDGMALAPTGGSMPLLIEVHGRLASFVRLGPDDIDAMWARTRSLEGHDFEILHPADQLLHVCLHLARGHRFAMGLYALVDLTLHLVRWHETIDWAAWCSLVERADERAAVWPGLRLAADWLDAPVPDAVLSRLQPARWEELLDLAEEQIWLSGQQLRPALENLLGGGGRGPWWRERVLGRHWRSAGGEGRTGGRRLAATVGRIARELWKKSAEYGGSFRKGRLTSSTFRSQARSARARGRILEILDER